MFSARFLFLNLVLLSVPLGLAMDQTRPHTETTRPADVPSGNRQALTSDSLAMDHLLRDHPFFNQIPLPDPKSVRHGLKSGNGNSDSGLDATSILGSTTVEYRTEVGLGLGVSSDTAWSLSESVRLSDHLIFGVYLLKKLDPATTSAVHDITSSPNAAPEPDHQVQLRLSWEF